MALIFALLGDIFLLQEAENYFLLGLGSFFIMQLLYAYVFAKQIRIGALKEIDKIIYISIVGILLNFFLWNHTGGLRLPVICYTLSILAMAITATVRWKVSGYKQVLWGVLLFVFSDSYLGINKFRISLWEADLVVMSSYMAAQGLIVFGYVKGLKNQF